MELSLRERKKRETRQRIADVAMGLFMARGFDNVTVAEVARHADVSVNTVFNYFRTKEDLFADRHELVLDFWVNAVRDREPGESAIAALRRDYLDALDHRHWRIGFHEGADTFARMIQESPALTARLREIHEQRVEALARCLAEETGADADDPLPAFVAAQVGAVVQTLTGRIARRKMAGETLDEIYPGARADAEMAFGLLERGIGDYCARSRAEKDRP